MPALARLASVRMAGGVHRAVFSPNGKHDAAACWDGRAVIASAQTGQRIAQWQSRGVVVVSATLHPDGESLAIASEQGDVSIVRLEPDNRAIEQLTTAAEVLANQRIDQLGGLHSSLDFQSPIEFEQAIKELSLVNES